MSKAPNFAVGSRHTGEAPRLTAPQPLVGIGGLRIRLDWITRPVFGIALAAVAIGSIVAGPYAFAGVVALLSVAAAREWHRMVGYPDFAREVFVGGATIAASIFVFMVAPHTFAPWIVLFVGAVATYVSASLRHAKAAWHAGGILYIGVPAIALAALRGEAHDGAWLMIGLFLAIWATDTGALISGNLIGGAKLWPDLSPNKTWSGTLGGTVVAAIVEAIFLGVLGGNAVLGALYGASIAIVGHAGDLFESWTKRRFQFKDSGGLIPGHGGVLDRIDSTLAAATAIAAAVFLLGLDPLFGARP